VSSQTARALSRGIEMKLLEREIAGAPLLTVEPTVARGDGPHPVDRHVGLRIRMRRKEIGVSQERLAEALGITFQQVQKYERGANRVSASKLWEIATALRTPVGYFYEGLNAGEPSARDAAQAQDFMLSSDGIELMSAFPRILEPAVRRKLVELVCAVADDA
jgi:transcriptional regulator with XRE-family HTH domain